MGRAILVADDEPEVLRMLGEMLHQEGYEVLLARNGKEAVRRAKTSPIELAIIDMLMPVMDGLEVLEAIQKIDPTIVCILITGHESLHTLKRAVLDEEAFDYLIKPFKRSELMKTVEKGLLRRDFRLRNYQEEGSELRTRLLKLERDYSERTFELRQSQIQYKQAIEKFVRIKTVPQDEKIRLLRQDFEGKYCRVEWGNAHFSGLVKKIDNGFLFLDFGFGVSVSNITWIEEIRPEETIGEKL